MYGHFISKMSTTSTAMKKYNEVYNTANYQLDWEKNYSLSFQITLDTKIREFQDTSQNLLYKQNAFQI